MKKIKIVIFDMDGTIFQGSNFWLDMHHKYNNANTALDFFQSNKEKSYEDVFKKMSQKFWKGLSAEQYADMIKKRSYFPQIKEVIHTLKKQGYLIGIISSGPYDLALRAKKELQIDIIRANQLTTDHRNVFTGKAIVQVDDTDKYQALKPILDSLNIKNTEVAMVGDGENDISIAQKVGLTFTINSSSKKLSEIAKYNLSANDIYMIVNHLTSWNKKSKKRQHEPKP